MKIIIAGAGAVGTHLARLLSKDNQDIVVIDESSQKTATLTDSGSDDLMVINASPTSISSLKEAGVQYADLFIAVTPHESVNINCCLLAHTLGAKKTVARVDNSEYMLPQYQQVFRDMGVDSLIYPEMLASQEIIEGLKHSWVRQCWEVHGGALVMLGIKLRTSAHILNSPLKFLTGNNSHYHIVAIKRDSLTIIPGGNDCLKEGDIAYFMTTRNYVESLRKLCGKEDYTGVRNVMVMGGGKTTVLLGRTKPAWFDLRIIEADPERCQRLNEMLDNEDIIVINGNSYDSTTLLEEGIRQCEAFVALSEEAEKNILACLAAKRLGVKKTVAMVDEMDYMDVAERLDIGVTINKKVIAASHIYRMMLSAGVADLKCLALANADVAEFITAEGSLATKHLVKDLGLPQNVALGGLVRNGVGMSINGMTQIEAGDNVVVFALEGKIKETDRFFKAQPDGLFNRIKNKL